jgi:dTMP kinase
MKKGSYIIFEGCHGTGKTTQSKKLVEFLKKKFPGKEIIWTREPGGSEIAELIRKLVQGTNFTEEIDPVCEAYLYAASRAQTLRRVVSPVLSKGGIVIQDNSFITGMAYQALTRGLGLENYTAINEIALGDFLPDIIIHLDLSLQVSTTRTFDKDGDRFERLGIEFDKKVERSYKKISKLPMFKGKWISVNADGEISDVFNKILKRII